MDLSRGCLQGVPTLHGELLGPREGSLAKRKTNLLLMDRLARGISEDYLQGVLLFHERFLD